MNTNTKVVDELVVDVKDISKKIEQYHALGYFVEVEFKHEINELNNVKKEYKLTILRLVETFDEEY